SSAKNFEMVKFLGANSVIDYKTEDFTQSSETYDIIFDAVRKLSSSATKKSLTDNGVFLTAGSSTKETPENLVFLRDLIEEGNLSPFIDRTYSLEEIAEAHRYVDTGRKRGNVAIKVSI
ncbi:MAG: zinc-binding dehydrogenase, partial [Candidatus Thorarchaeota archaeon]